ncbi:PLDc N-terminal domain-containing protein [Saprospiraceae bacterium]|jgi:predicted membrane channel-forming protein YqfA (hemolysin III family)|nr:PLDc N-terminal domain-containing protein [Bacteroidota bacterium]MDB4728395.1 PLDc N-terminal domain-containing protein [Saprospiraceae bacterium]MDF1867216.1 PLDc N-terminal domain-containing protein [Saprospiraceae bacterium]
MIALFVFCFVVTMIIIYVKTIIEIVSHDFANNDKLVWLVLVIMLPVLGTILYYLFGQKNMIKNHEEFV